MDIKSRQSGTIPFSPVYVQQKMPPLMFCWVEEEDKGREGRREGRKEQRNKLRGRTKAEVGQWCQRSARNHGVTHITLWFHLF